MNTTQMKAIFLICLVIGAEAVRVGDEIDDRAESEDTCGSKEEHMKELAKYVTQKCEKVENGYTAIDELESKQTSGWRTIKKKLDIRKEEKKQRKRVVKLG